MQGTVETFICVECEQQLNADKLAFDTDSEHRLGVCIDCEPAVTVAQALPVFAAREVA